MPDKLGSHNFSVGKYFLCLTTFHTLSFHLPTPSSPKFPFPSLQLPPYSFPLPKHFSPSSHPFTQFLPLLPSSHVHPASFIGSLLFPVSLSLTQIDSKRKDPGSGNNIGSPPPLSHFPSPSLPVLYPFLPGSRFQKDRDSAISCHIFFFPHM